MLQVRAYSSSVIQCPKPGTCIFLMVVASVKMKIVDYLKNIPPTSCVLKWCNHIRKCKNNAKWPFLIAHKLPIHGIFGEYLKIRFFISSGVLFHIWNNYHPKLRVTFLWLNDNIDIDAGAISVRNLCLLSHYAYRLPKKKNFWYLTTFSLFCWHWSCAFHTFPFGLTCHSNSTRRISQMRVTKPLLRKWFRAVFASKWAMMGVISIYVTF